ncbi:MAG TPA: hypothetical protein VK670_04485 [Silvibacterium sp.]|nr:hypothetical protein [Silvibacterium sp.]
MPLRPDFSFPFFIACISRSTDFEALGLYLRPLDFFELDFFAELFFEDELFFALPPFLEVLFFVLVFFDGMMAFLQSLRSD